MSASSSDDESASSRSSSDEEAPRAEAPTVGHRVDEDHPHHNFVYIMLLGIQTAVSAAKQGSEPRFVNEEDCSEHVSYSFKSDGSLKTAQQKHADFKFRDYGPRAFRALRNIFFSESDYPASLTSQFVLTELGSPGKSGAFFYLSPDLMFVLKTITKTEAKLFRALLHRYYQHFCENPSSLLVRFCGLHRLKPHKGKRVYFVSMQSVFSPSYDIHQKFDLKGSLYKRSVGEQNLHKPGAVLKDLDFIKLDKEIKLGPVKREMFLHQLQMDVMFLSRLGVMDYSLLIGIHDLTVANSRRIRQTALSEVRPYTEYSSKEKLKAAKLNRGDYKKAKREMTLRRVRVRAAEEVPSETEGISCVSSSVFSQEHGGLISTNSDDEELDEVYYLGVIDFLQQYTASKKTEHAVKTAMCFGGDAISCVAPDKYAERLVNFVYAHTTDAGSADFDAAQADLVVGRIWSESESTSGDETFMRAGRADLGIGSDDRFAGIQVAVSRSRSRSGSESSERSLADSDDRPKTKPSKKSRAGTAARKKAAGTTSKKKATGTDTKAKGKAKKSATTSKASGKKKASVKAKSKASASSTTKKRASVGSGSGTKYTVASKSSRKGSASTKDTKKAAASKKASRGSGSGNYARKVKLSAKVDSAAATPKKRGKKSVKAGTASSSSSSS